MAGLVRHVSDPALSGHSAECPDNLPGGVPAGSAQAGYPPWEGKGVPITYIPLTRV
jgi:hypothetical protein